MSAIRAIAVVIPARDESGYIGRCIASVRNSARNLGTSADVSITVVADGCSDGTAGIARAHGGTEVVETSPLGVGSARRIGVQRALERIPWPAEQIWIANTDADSFVDAQWLRNNLRAAGRGSLLRIGAVKPNFRDLELAQIDAWKVRHASGAAIGHVHGANLGIRASTYLAVGGFRSLARAEDVDLVERVQALGARAEAAEDPDVITSGRLDARAAGGYAAFLADGLLGGPNHSDYPNHRLDKNDGLIRDLASERGREQDDRFAAL
jgi:glycosyltransferase involved in cell wall biosynthesis